MIALNNVEMVYPVTKRYREYLLQPFRPPKGVIGIQNANLKIEKGDCIGFLGPNSAGKTTILKLIGGLLYPTAGDVYVNGYDTSKNNLEARQSVGFVINEDRSFYWRLTGRQNLEFFGALDNMYGKILVNRIDELISMVELEDVLSKPVATYSSGMRQRLAIARGLLADPDILILDEPTRTLDPLSGEKMRLLINKEIYRSKGKTVLIATHLMAEADFLCNKLCMINKGEIKAFENKSEIKEKYSDLDSFYREMISVDE